MLNARAGYRGAVRARATISTVCGDRAERYIDRETSRVRSGHVETDPWMELAYRYTGTGTGTGGRAFPYTAV